MKHLLHKKYSKVTILAVTILVIGNTINTLATRSKPGSITNIAKTYATLDNQTVDKISRLDSPIVDLFPKIDPPPIYAKGYIVIQSGKNYPLASQNDDLHLPIASTTKIMTALVTLDTLNLDKTVTISKTAANVMSSGSGVNFITGEQLSVKNLLYAMLMNSANDAAYALSEANGSTDDFVTKMNQKAQLLGLHNTLYKNPAGLDDTAYSTPRDLAILIDYAMGHYPLFRTIIHTGHYSITSADDVYGYDLKNSNRLVDDDEPLYLPESIGGKTGYTDDAGHCLVAAAENNGKRYIAVILNTSEWTTEASAKEARKALLWAEKQ